MSDQSKGRNQAKQVLPKSQFNHGLNIEARNTNLTSELGVIGLRELDQRLDLISGLSTKLYDPRNQSKITHQFVELLRTRLFSNIQGWNEQDDVDKLRHDGAFRLGVSERPGDEPLRVPVDPLTPNGLCSQPTQSRLINVLSSDRNRKQLKDELLTWAYKGQQVLNANAPTEATLDLDSTMLRTFGMPGGADYNGHYGCNGYHPLLAFWYEARAWVGAELRMGSTWSAEGAKDFCLPILAAMEKKLNCPINLRGDAAFAEDDLMNALERYTGLKGPLHYCFRIKNNANLSKIAKPFLDSPQGRKPKIPRVWTHNLEYQAESWKRKRRVILVVKENHEALYNDFFFLVTNFNVDARNADDVLAYYRKRGTMEGDIGQLKAILDPHFACTSRTSLSWKMKNEMEIASREAFCNEATLLMSLLSYNLMNIGCRVMSKACPLMDQNQSGHVPKEDLGPRKLDEYRYDWSMGRFRNQVLKTAGRITTGGRRATIIISHYSGILWRRFWDAIVELPVLNL